MVPLPQETAHLPDAQTSTGLQAAAHLPQFLRFACRSTQVPLQPVNPG